MTATVTAPWTYTLHLPHDPRAPGIARTTLRAVLRSHHLPELIETAELLASELVTNAHQYSGGPYALRLRVMAPDRVRVGVWDSNPDIPPPFQGMGRAPDECAESGRGLFLVQLCADEWGAYSLAGDDFGWRWPGKLLWVEFRVKGWRWTAATPAEN
ncbi:ATP-binding protein [Streptomyces apocyni]|uniref:ATP-binding protein n=1 Tax=Streptomyces apocyni TaxID=2654677 RepID=UPI0012E9D53B|nr:ATP-binding protein [Streptomyces apocyni]